VLAPDLFNVYLDTVVRQLLPIISKYGVKISYSVDGHLTECSNSSYEELMWILMYANDIAIICDDVADLFKGHG